MLRAQGRDLHAEFIRLLPAPPQPIPIQRWSWRRVGLLAAVGLLLVLVLEQGTLSINFREAVETPAVVGNLACADLEPQWLLAQSVPSASLVPCLGPLPAGWSVGPVTVNDGRSVIHLNHDRAGTNVLVIELTAGCNPQGAVQASSTQPQVRRYERIDRQTPRYQAVVLDQFPGRLRHHPGTRASSEPDRDQQRAGADPSLHHPAGTPTGTGPALGWTTAARPTCRVTRYQPAWLASHAHETGVRHSMGLPRPPAAPSPLMTLGRSASRPAPSARA
jgi:hypothetical protein